LTYRQIDPKELEKEMKKKVANIETIRQLEFIVTLAGSL